MPATDRYQLLVESQTRGEDAVRRMDESLKRLSENTVRGNERMARGFATVAAGVYATEKAFSVATTSLAAFTRAQLQADNAAQRLLLTYRTLRTAAAIPAGGLAVAGSLAFTGAAVAARVATGVTLQRASQVQSAGFTAAQNSVSFQSAFALQRAGSVTGRDVGILLSRTPQEINDLARSFAAIEDPVQRSAAAFREFGANGQKALDLLDGRFLNAVSKAHDLSEELDGPTRVALGQFKDFFRDFKPFEALGDSASNFSERLKVSLAKATVDLVQFSKRALQAGIAVDAEGRPIVVAEGVIQGPFLDPRPPAERLRGLSDPELTRSARESLAERLAAMAPASVAFDPRLLSAATGAIGRFDSSIPGVQAELASAERRLAANRELFQLSDGQMRGILAPSLLQDEAVVERLKTKLKELEKTAEAIEKRASLIASLPELARQSELSTLSPIGRIIGESGDLLNKLGPGFGPQVLSIFGPRLAEEKLRMQSGAAKDFASFVGGRTSGFQGELDRISDLNTSFFLQNLRGTIGDQERGVSRDRQLLDSLFGGDASRARRRAQFASGSLSLAMGVGGETGFANADYSIRIQLAKDLYEITQRRISFESDADRKEIDMARALADFEREADEAGFERQMRLLELGRRRREEARGLASDFVGSIQSGNVGGFFRNQAGRLINQVGTNALEGPIDGLLGKLGKVGAASGFGSLFRGTVFDPQNASVDRNTMATEANTAALTSSLVGKSGAGIPVPGFPGLIGGPGGAISVFGSDTNGITGRRLSPLAPDAGIFGGFSKVDRSIEIAPGVATTASAAGLLSKSGRLGNIVGSASLIAGGAFGAYDGFKRGGAQGVLSGTASLAGSAAGLMTLAGVSGPAAPIVAGVGLALATIASLFGDPKKRRDREIERLINDSLFTEPANSSFNVDRFGLDVDYGRGGLLRSFSGSFMQSPAVRNIAEEVPENTYLELMQFRKRIADASSDGFRSVFGREVSSGEAWNRMHEIVKYVQSNRGAPSVTINISAMDAKSVMDRRADIADAMQTAMYEGHSVNRAAREVVLAQ